MFALKIFVFLVLLGCGLSFVMPDIEQDSMKLELVSKRDQKRLDLLKSLEEFSSEVHQVIPTVKNITQPDLPLLIHPEFPELRARMAETSLEKDSFPDEKNIHSYQDYFRIMYGTPEGVNLLRKKYGPTGLQRARAQHGVDNGMDDVRLVNNHYLKIRSHAKCKAPVPQVIRVKDYYPHPSIEYWPRCTILHRCGDFAGCCDSDAFHCVPSAIQEVALHFYTLTIGKRGLTGMNGIEKLLFQNHTACQCQPINDLPRLQKDGSNLQDGKEGPPSKSKCKECPVPFTNRIYKDGRCGCDCFDRQKPCLRIKRGRESLSPIERRCVQAKQCHIPDCEYGLYDAQTGFCPRRHDEDQRTHQRRPNQLHHNHRWTHVERD
ncbi:vascular endothelial growth factor A [Caerostris darwini]|uniref:Vascular endothelial growth factor A n=1 Tax=Caerostris darwini TaxID=1538125 RepID=A0AAV4QLY9_9ARAC|nr:vascular endothelial growth factor A [Caerostris darwini]